MSQKSGKFTYFRFISTEVIKSRKNKELIYKKPDKPTLKRPTLLTFAGAYVYINKNSSFVVQL